MSLALHRHEIEQLAKSVTNLADIAYSINRVHSTRYTANDIQRIMDGKQPRKQREWVEHPPQPAAVNKKVGEPIGYCPPLSTLRDGGDPLAIATNAYIERNRAKIEALAQ